MDFSVFSILLILLFLLPTSAVSKPSANATLGSSLTATSGNSYWTSPSGEFAFGFSKTRSGGYLLAIWFNKIPEKTVVWSANRDNLAPEGSKVQLSQDGRFVLSDSSGQHIWNAKSGSSRVAYGAMLDSGNFILASNVSGILWQTFDDPTDSLLPSQLLRQGGRLVSSLSQMNYSSGDFFLVMQGDGVLVLYTTNLPTVTVNDAYWSTRSVGSGFQFIFNQSGSVSLVRRNGSIINSVFSNTASTSQFYQRVTLDHDGVLAHYVYPKSANSSGGRQMAWSVLNLVPSDICSSITQLTRRSVCGYNSYCSLSIDQKPVCNCLDGYTLLDPDDNTAGCKPNFVPQNCDQDSKESDLFYFVDMPNTDWPRPHLNIEHYPSVTEEECRQVCLNDCFCALVVYEDSSCWKKTFPLSNGRKDPSFGGKALSKIRRENSIANSNETNTKRKCHSVLIITGSVLLSSSGFLNIVFLLALFLLGYRLRKRSNSYPSYPALPGLSIRSFSYKELEEATNGFKQELGSGAYSIVYKGTLKNESENLVAVKKLNDMIKDSDHEFQAEVSSISRTNHRNLVKLVGYCNDGQHRLLVYEYMNNGSLANYLFAKPRPNWYKRVQIAFQTARGLSYLHEECSNQIIHCDIKPQNVLLDDSFTAKISDFGLAKLLKTDQTKTTTGIRGTRGYVAPEWFRNMPITFKVDVYSFGILLLELVCCRRNVEIELKDEKQVILSDWAYDCYAERKIYSLIASDEEAQGDMKRVENFVMIAIWCIQVEPTLRPSMKRVVQMLEGSVQVSTPPYSSSLISSIN